MASKVSYEDWEFADVDDTVADTGGSMTPSHEVYSKDDNWELADVDTGGSMMPSPGVADTGGSMTPSHGVYSKDDDWELADVNTGGSTTPSAKVYSDFVEKYYNFLVTKPTKALSYFNESSSVLRLRKNSQILSLSSTLNDIEKMLDNLSYKKIEVYAHHFIGNLLLVLGNASFFSGDPKAFVDCFHMNDGDAVRIKNNIFRYLDIVDPAVTVEQSGRMLLDDSYLDSGKYIRDPVADKGFIRQKSWSEFDI